MELAEREWSNAEEIKQVKQQHAKNLHKMREGRVANASRVLFGTWLRPGVCP